MSAYAGAGLLLAPRHAPALLRFRRRRPQGSFGGVAGEPLRALLPRLRPSNSGLARGMKNDMNRQEILDRLRQNERALRARGVTHAALFGSRARGDERPDSDTDIMIEVDPEARITVYDYVDLKEYIAGLFDGGVDVVNREGLKPYVRPLATADAVYAF